MHYCVFFGLQPLDFSKEKEKPPKKDDGEIDEQFWEIILSADRKDYERICMEFGVKDLRLILKKLEEKKHEREEEQSKVCKPMDRLFMYYIIYTYTYLFIYKYNDYYLAESCSIPSGDVHSSLSICHIPACVHSLCLIVLR